MLNGFAVVCGAAALTPIVLLADGPGSPENAGGVLGLLHLGLVVSGVAYALYFTAARDLPSTHVVIITLLEPVAATIIAAITFDEALTVATVVGGVLLLSAVAALRPGRGQVADPSPVGTPG